MKGTADFCRFVAASWRTSDAQQRRRRFCAVRQGWSAEFAEIRLCGRQRNWHRRDNLGRGCTGSPENVVKVKRAAAMIQANSHAAVRAGAARQETLRAERPADQPVGSSPAPRVVRGPCACCRQDEDEPASGATSRRVLARTYLATEILCPTGPLLRSSDRSMSPGSRVSGAYTRSS